MMKPSSSTVDGTNTSTKSSRLAPSSPKTSSRAASTSRLKAYSPCSCRRRAQLMSTAVVAAPATKARSDDAPALARAICPSTRFVGASGDDAGHVRGVALYRQEPARVDGPGNKGQQPTELPVGASCSNLG